MPRVTAFPRPMRRAAHRRKFDDDHFACPPDCSPDGSRSPCRARPDRLLQHRSRPSTLRRGCGRHRAEGVRASGGTDPSRTDRARRLALAHRSRTRVGTAAAHATRALAAHRDRGGRVTRAAARRAGRRRSRPDAPTEHRIRRTPRHRARGGGAPARRGARAGSRGRDAACARHADALLGARTREWLVRARKGARTHRSLGR